jgi:Fic family protein
MLSIPVPPMGSEEARWVVPDTGLISRRKQREGTGAYRSAVPAKLADFTPELDAQTATDMEEALIALARFDDYAATKLDVHDQTLGPMSSVLLRTESSSSSRLENLTVGARALALAEIQPDGAKGNAAEVVGNVRAMEAAIRLPTVVSIDSILTMHRELLGHLFGWRERAGRFRDQLVWVGSSSVSPIGAKHIAPQAALVPKTMADLVEFANRQDLPILLRVAVAHAQFETIHPFPDGNGRVGRALVHIMLRAGGVLTHVIAPISAGLLVNSGEYFDALDTYRAGDAGPLLEQFVDASLFAAKTGMELIDALAVQLSIAREHLASFRADSLANRVIPYLVSQPVLDTHYLVDRVGLSDSGAARALAQLTEAGVLRERTGNKRNRVWQHDGILKVLDDYAERLRRE